MAKQRADNGIDYTPRREKAVEAAAAAKRTLERVVHGVVQRRQHYPIFEVTAGGKSIEWTDIRADAHAAFHKADALPKLLMLVHEDGRRVLLDEVSYTGRARNPQLALAA